MTPVTIVGGGLAGAEAALTLAGLGVKVELFEMRPAVTTGAHQTDQLAEVVCSNSFGSKHPHKANGLLRSELQLLGSKLLEYINQHSVPAGEALAVDREGFARAVTRAIETHPLIRVIRREVTELPNPPAILATGPLTSAALSQSLQNFLGCEALSFFDALSPIVDASTINRTVAFKASRYQDTAGDYLNCPLNEPEYRAFVRALLGAERIPLRSFEQAVTNGVRAGMHRFFEGCLPIEILAERGMESLAFGPMRPVGLIDPRTGRRPHAVCQLRQDNAAASLFNLVGFQTNLRVPEQERVLRMIPGLERAEFVRYGQMHRNTFLASPLILTPALNLRAHPNLFLAGQITGIEGYLGNIASGLLAALNMHRWLSDLPALILPQETMLGALTHYICHASIRDFQPMKANFGLLPPLKSTVRISKRDRGRAHAERSIRLLNHYLNNQGLEQTIQGI